MAIPNLTDYITPAPPFLAGSDRLSQAISAIWLKRNEDEKRRIETANQVAQQAYWEANAAHDVRADTELARHQLATEQHARNQLGRDIAKDRMSYVGDVAKAYDEGHPGVGNALSANSYLFGIPPQIMAAPVAESGASDLYNPDGSMRGPTPGSNLGPSQPSTEGAIPGADRGPPPYTQADADAENARRAAESRSAPAQAVPAEVAAGPYGAPVQGQPPAANPAELNAPKETTPPPPSPDATQPPAPAQPAAPAQAAPAPAPRSNVTPGDLGQPQGVVYTGPVGPGGWPATPWDTDIRRHPIAREANPNWQQKPTTFPGTPAGAPSAGPSAGAAPGPGSVGGAPTGVDPATERRWMMDRGVAAPVTMPDRARIVEGNAERVRQALQPAYGLATDAREMAIVRAGIEAGAAAVQTMSSENARNKAMEMIRDDLRMYRQGQRNLVQAEATANRFQRTEERERANKYVDRQIDAINSRGLDNDVAVQQEMQKMRGLLQNRDPNSTEWSWAVRNALTIMKNKGASTDRDALEAEGKHKLNFLDNIQATVEQLIKGPPPLLIENMVQATKRLQELLTDRTRRDYENHRRLVKDLAPNDYAREQAYGVLRERYMPFSWARAMYEEERTGGPPPKAPAVREPPPSPTPRREPRLPPGVEVE